MKSLPNRIVLATRNRGKVKEISDLVADLPVELLSLSDIAPDFDVVEDRDTFQENAMKKAREVAHATGLTALADDSGLCIDPLDGRPGVLSARYAGEGATDEEKCARILNEMAHVSDDRRGAHFVCVLALATPEGEEKIFEGRCMGRITREPRGDQGFGYDPIFFHEESGLTFAQMDRDSKNAVSHRGRSLRQLAAYLRTLASGKDPDAQRPE